MDIYYFNGKDINKKLNYKLNNYNSKVHLNYVERSILMGEKMLLKSTFNKIFKVN